MNPDLQTLPEAATWHYVVAVGLFAVMGAVGHVVRAASISCRIGCRIGR